jgi:hypothetical protein
MSDEGEIVKLPSLNCEAGGVAYLKDYCTVGGDPE